MPSLNESIVEEAALEWFGELGYAVGHGPHLAPGEYAVDTLSPTLSPTLSQRERGSYSEVVLVGRLREAIPTPDDIFGPPAQISVPSSPNLKGSSPNLSENRDDNGYLIADFLALPIIDDIAALAPSLRGFLEKIAAVPRTKGKVDREVLIAVVLQLCARHFVTLRCLALLVNRKPETLRDQYLTKLVRERKLTLAFPKTPTHEQQAYAAAEAT